MIYRLAIIVACLGVVLGALIEGGPRHSMDPRLIVQLLDGIAAYPHLTNALRWVTHLGSAMILLGITAAVTLGLIANGKRRDALWFATTVVTGRIMVELMKLLVERPRPELMEYSVPVTSYSFPSGHAANSMITFLALALLLPETKRRRAVAAALLASLVVGLTRPLLGVHWPTDVVAGWAFGILWLTMCSSIVRTRGETAT